MKGHYSTKWPWHCEAWCSIFTHNISVISTQLCYAFWAIWMCILYYAFFSLVWLMQHVCEIRRNVCFSYLTNGALILCGSTSDNDFRVVHLMIGDKTRIHILKVIFFRDFTALFYKKYWSIVKDWFFLVLGISLGTITFNKSKIIRSLLIPKQLGASSVHHFYPISLYNIIYKIISKILANRFKGLLHCFISPYQFAFVPNRTI